MTSGYFSGQSKDRATNNELQSGRLVLIFALSVARLGVNDKGALFGGSSDP